MHKGFLKTAAISGALSVMLGAMAAHFIKNRFDPDSYSIFQTAVLYQFFHTFALLATGVLYREFRVQQIIWAGRFFISGIFLFSGSLYLLAYFKYHHTDAMLWLGAVTPLGGVCFIAGWLFLFVAFLGKKDRGSSFS